MNKFDLPVSRAKMLLRSDFGLLQTLYRVELEYLVRGIPSGPLALASAIRSPLHIERVIAVAVDPVHRHSQQHAEACIVGALDVPREQVLAMADEAQVARRYRRCVQIYGWLLLSSRDQDNAMEWAQRHLERLASTVYAHTSGVQAC